MTRRLKRTSQYELALTIKSDDFIRPPREAQRNWILNRLVKEIADDLSAIDQAAQHFVPGAERAGGFDDRTQSVLGDSEIMEDWQIPVMRAMAEAVADANGHILEIGFGRGIASDLIQQYGAGIHTIVECNNSVVDRYHRWRERYPHADIRIIHSMWQDIIEEPEMYDGVFFHTYPLNNDDFMEQIANSTTFAEHFFAHAARKLRPGGVFTYLTNEYDSLSRGHQRSLFRHFNTVTLSKVSNLKVPENTMDAMWANSMMIVKAIKGP